jgi:hypothetical protein
MLPVRNPYETAGRKEFVLPVQNIEAPAEPVEAE